MKKIILALLLAVTTLSAHAQFEKGTSYLNTSLTGLNLSYSKGQKFNFGLQATGGYFFEDCWMAYGRFGYNHPGPDLNAAIVGAGARYYDDRFGYYLNLGLQYEHAAKSADYLQLTPEVGYCFYLNHHVSIEPAVYFDICLNKFSEGSTVGLKLGFGYYF